MTLYVQYIHVCKCKKGIGVNMTLYTLYACMEVSK
jgi:hypothetical protein